MNHRLSSLDNANYWSVITSYAAVLCASILISGVTIASSALIGAAVSLHQTYKLSKSSLSSGAIFMTLVSIGSIATHLFTTLLF